MDQSWRETLELTVLPLWEGRTVGRLLRGELGLTDHPIARLKRRPDGLRLNGSPCRVTDRVRAGDVLSVRIGDPDRPGGAEPVSVPLAVVYEDGDLAVIDKPAGMVVHGAAGGPPTVANALAALWGPERPFHPVHRLDRGTSGLLVVAKSAYVQERLRRMLHTDAFRREYLALTGAVPVPEEGCVELPIGRDGTHPTRRSIDPRGQSARTDYALEERFPGGALLRLRPVTGRTHQIRVHMAAVGCPLLGDALYGGELSGLTRPALHSAHIVLRQPLTGELLDLRSPLPADLEAVRTRESRKEKESP